ncbi:MAG: autotransporter domain-containing protein, partial [Glaciimonas sp.]|nr:autotransporter domain-containing protein [Glaciimonas sp.]
NDINSTVIVGGTATLGGSHLVATIPAGNSAGDAYITTQAGTTSKILTAGVGVVGQFGSTSFENNGTAFTPTLITPTVSYSGKEVNMSIVRNNVTAVAAQAFGTDATRNNSAANVEQALKVADNMAASGQTGGANAAFLASAAALQRSANIDAVGAALDSLSGQIYASAQAQTFQQSQAINRDLSNRLAQLGESNVSTGFWTTAIGASGKLAQSGYAGASTSIWGGQFGVDTQLNKQTILGAAVAYSEGRANFDRFGGNAKSQYVGGSLYARYALANTGAYVTGRAGVAIVDSNIERAAIVGTETQRLQASHLDHTFSGYVEAGNTLKISDKNTITPFGGISYDRVRRGSFAETGGSFGLSASSQTYQQVAGLLGVRGDSSFAWFAGNSKL